MLVNSHVHLTKLIEIEKNKLESNSFLLTKYQLLIMNLSQHKTSTLSILVWIIYFLKT